MRSGLRARADPRSRSAPAAKTTAVAFSRASSTEMSQAVPGTVSGEAGKREGSGAEARTGGSGR